MSPLAWQLPFLRILKMKNGASPTVAYSHFGGDSAMRTDADLKADLMERLDAIPSIDASNIEVNVDHGMVLLSGKVDTHQTRFQVERTARAVHGMRGLEIQIKPTQSFLKRRVPG
jgi:osmotically-inducible protein OsmY